MPGPETITIQKELKRDGDSFLKIDDNQNKKWNTDIPDIVSNLQVGMTVDVWYEIRDGQFTDDSGAVKAYQSKYILKAQPSNNPPQQLKAPFQGGGGGQKRSGGGGKGDGDFRTSGENIAIDALHAAVKLHAGILQDRVTAGDVMDAAARTVRASVMGTAEVFSEFIRAEGLKLGSSKAAAAAPNENGTYGPGQTPSGWGAAPAQGVPTEQIGFGPQADDDLGGL